MNQTLITTILVAITVTVLMWAGAQYLSEYFNSERKKIKERLSGDARPLDVAAMAEQASIRRRIDVGGLTGRLMRIQFMADIHQALALVWPRVTLPTFIGISLGLAAAVLMIVYALLGLAIVAIGASTLAGAAPFMILQHRRTSRRNLLSGQLPEALDFLGRIMRAGHGLSSGFQMISEELSQPLAGEFGRCYDAHSVGQSMEDALRETAVRIDCPDFGFFVTAVLIQRQTGGDLAEVLDNISNMIRGRVRLQQHVRAKTAEGRLTGYILTAFPLVMFFVSYSLNPAYAGILFSDRTGIYMLCAAALMCILGLVVIRKITTVKV
jgi:tight adherence protein B